MNPLHLHTHSSLLDGLSKPWQVAARARKVGAKACAISDHGTISGVPSFLKAMAGACKHCGYQPNQHADGGKGKCTLAGVTCHAYEKDPIKPILGEEFYLCQQDATIREKENGPLSHLVVLAKNLAGWKNLVQASTASNRPEHFYRKPRLDLDRLAAFAKGQWVTFSGHPGSDMANICFGDIRAAYSARTYEDAKLQTKPWPELKRDAINLAMRYQELFGKGNFFLEVQLIDSENLPAANIIAKIMRYVSNETGIPLLATPDAHYPSRDDAIDQRVLLCSAVDTTLGEAERRLAAGEDVSLGGFFRSTRYHIPSREEMVACGHTEVELNACDAVAEMCETYDIFNKPRLPQFDCPGGSAPDQYLKQLCAEGWRRKIEGRVPKERMNEYKERMRMELGVLCPAGLSPYFLIVHDLCHYAQAELKCKKPRGRGSAAGCLVSYLLDVADCDPVKYGLIFERFYNAGRNDLATGRVSLPDIDMDFPISKREQVVDYARRKYGEGRVAQMVTFGRMQGRTALSDVFRAREWGSFEDRKRVTQFIPDESAIADELQVMREETGEASIIKWALEHNADELKEYCVLNEDGTLSGPLESYFAQAMRLEGTKRSQGKHAAGVIISPVDLSDECPMLYDKSTERMVAGFEMADMEALGFVKLDVLGVAAYDKVSGAFRTARTGMVGME